MTVPLVSSLTGDTPQRNQIQSVFRANADLFATDFARIIPELRATILAINSEVLGGNFQGDWSAQTGAAAVPYVVWHNGSLWALTTNIADVTASTPSVSNSDWIVFSNPPGYDEIIKTLTTTTPTMNLSEANIFEITLTGNTTITVSGAPSGSAGTSFLLAVTQDGSGSGYTLGFTGATLRTENNGGLPSMTDAANAIDWYVGATLDNGSSIVVQRAVKNVG